jgi:hypothetical protein
MSIAGEKLDGWKEIACHLNRSVRAVQRWERTERLPVRRHGHSRGSSVYAFREELDAWWQKERCKPAVGSGERPAMTLTNDDSSTGRRLNESGKLLSATMHRNSLLHRDNPEMERMAREIAVIFIRLFEAVVLREFSAPQPAAARSAALAADSPRPIPIASGREFTA